MKLNIAGKEYKVIFDFNSFADSDLLERVEDMALFMNGQTRNGDSGMKVMRSAFVTVRELLFEGFKKENPVETLKEVGELLTTYMNETPKDENGEPLEDRGIFALFIQLSAELYDEGFCKDLMEKIVATNESKTPQDHKKPSKKK